jgi:hypothetical protein
MRRVLKIMMLLGAVLLIIPAPVYAYLDPGSGSMLLQLLLGGVAGLVVLVKIGWRKCLETLGLRKGEPLPTKTDPPPTDVDARVR